MYKRQYKTSTLSYKYQKTDWKKELTPLFYNHISYISEVGDKKNLKYICKKEACCILEKLKDKDINGIILNSQDNRSISSRLPVKLSKYKKR